MKIYLVIESFGNSDPPEYTAFLTKRYAREHAVESMNNNEFFEWNNAVIDENEHTPDELLDGTVDVVVSAGDMIAVIEVPLKLSRE